MMDGILNGKVAIVTGAGRGIGRAHAQALSRAGAAVVVNDLGVAANGDGKDSGPAAAVVAEILAAGGRAVADGTDISDWDAAACIVDTAVNAFGTLDILVNNAGISRFAGRLDALGQDDWLRTLAVNLNGTAALTHWAGAYWRSEGIRPGRAIVNTTSTVGLTQMPSVDLPNSSYAASKAAIAAMTLACAVEFTDLAVRVNAIAPVARSRISEFVAPDLVKPVSKGFDRMEPDNVAAVATYLASPLCRFTGKIVGIMGSDLTILQGWSVEHSFDNGPLRWTAEDLGTALAEVK